MYRKVTGPYYITLTMDHDTYRIRDVKTNKDYGSPVHLSRLRLIATENYLTQNSHTIHEQHRLTILQIILYNLYKHKLRKTTNGLQLNG